MSQFIGDCYCPSLMHKKLCLSKKNLSSNFIGRSTMDRKTLPMNYDIHENQQALSLILIGDRQSVMVIVGDHFHWRIKCFVILNKFSSSTITEGRPSMRSNGSSSQKQT